MQKLMFKSFLIMFLSYVIDSTITYFLPYNYAKTGISIIPSIGLLMFILLVKTFNNHTERFFFSVVCGLYYSIVYSNSIMIYVLIYLLVTFVLTYIYRMKDFQLPVYFVIVFLTLLVKEFSVYGLMRMTRVTRLSIRIFLLHRLLPTMIVNIIFVPVVYFIYKSLHLKDETSNDYEDMLI